MPTARKIKAHPKIGQAPPAPTNNYRTPITNVIIVQDASGSMRGWHNNAVATLNAQLSTIRQEAINNKTEARITVYPFAERLYAPLMLDKPTYEISNISISAYRSNGSSTALRNAARDAIQNVQMQSSVRDTYADQAYLLVVITDGEDNRSTLSEPSFAIFLSDLIATDKWTVTILCPPHQKQACINAGFPAGNVQEWEQSAQGFEDVQIQTQSAYKGYFLNRSRGIRSTNAFFQTDLSQVKAKDKRLLVPVPSADYRIHTVDREQGIREFVESKQSAPYRLGSAYYMLTKRETIQDHKDLLIQDRKTNEVFGDGAKIRALLGFPVGAGSIKVDPGNHANWNLFVQSTSTNRKLVRGTKLLVAR